MTKEKLDPKEIHELSWQRITSYFSEDLPLPFLYTTSATEAYNDMLRSAKSTHRVKGDIQVPNALLWFYSSDIVDAMGRCPLNFLFGGTLIPSERLDDTKEELLVGVTSENIKNLFRYRALIYSISAMAKERSQKAKDQGFFKQAQSFSDINVFLDGFYAFASEAFALDALRQDVAPDVFARALLKYKQISGKFLVVETDIEKRSEKLIERFNLFKEETEGYDPRQDWGKFLGVYAEFLGNPRLKDPAIDFLEQIRQSYPYRFFRRRISESEWEYVDVLF